jgi:SNF2 family DNA or RNA helicase
MLLGCDCLGYCYERLDGSVRSEERYLAVKNFSEMDEAFVFLLSTRAGLLVGQPEDI